MNARDHWTVVLRNQTRLIADALAEVDAEAPLPRYPLHKRLVWRLRRRVPAEVRAEQLWIRKTRAQRLMVAIQKRKP